MKSNIRICKGCPQFSQVQVELSKYENIPLSSAWHCKKSEEYPSCGYSGNYTAFIVPEDCDFRLEYLLNQKDK